MCFQRTAVLSHRSPA